MGRLSPSNRQIAHVLRTRSPVALASPRDLHVLSTPPAFVLSQDQTLQEGLIKALGSRCLTLLMTTSSSVVRITEMFGSNSPRRPERDRGSTSSPRTSRFPNSIINQRYKTFASLSATAFNHTRFRQRRQAHSATRPLLFLNRRPSPDAVRSLETVSTTRRSWRVLIVTNITV